MGSLTWSGFALRWLFALVLVFATYNAFDFSFLEWMKGDFKQDTPLKALAAILLIIGWVIFLRATFRSLSFGGVVLATALVAILVWTVYYYAGLTWEFNTITITVIEVAVSLVLALGMSWSHVRRRMTGQVDTDETDE